MSAEILSWKQINVFLIRDEKLNEPVPYNINYNQEEKKSFEI